jgi:hypothetical protein
VYLRTRDIVLLVSAGRPKRAHGNSLAANGSYARVSKDAAQDRNRGCEGRLSTRVATARGLRRRGFYSGSSSTGFTAKSVLPQFVHGSSLRGVSIRSPRVSKNSWASVTPPRDLRYSASASVS